MTRLRAVLAMACLAASIVSLFAADTPTLDRAASALGVDAIQSLEFEASGRYYQFGQAPAPELPWPAFDVTGYTATLDYARIAVHAKYRRVQVQEPGRARPHTDQTQDQYAAGGYSWNLTPAPTSIPTNLAERNAELWTSPQGFVKAARAHAAVVKPAPGGDATVTFTIDRVFRYEGLVSVAGDVLRVRTFMDSPVTAVLAKIRELFPDRTIAGVINTHAHFDHAGGLRTYVDAGVPVVTHARNAAYYARAWAAPHTIAPDRLAASKRKPRFRTFTTKLVLADERHPIEIHAVAGSGHNDAFAMVFLPKDGLLVEGDAWTPAATRPATPSPLWINLHENIQRLGLGVQRIAPLHGTLQTIHDLRAAIAR